MKIGGLFGVAALGLSAAIMGNDEAREKIFSLAGEGYEKAKNAFSKSSADEAPLDDAPEVENLVPSPEESVE